MPGAHAHQFTFRLSDDLLKGVDGCLERIRQSGLTVTRTDVVRMLIKHALENVQLDAKELLFGRPAVPRSDGPPAPPATGR